MELKASLDSLLSMARRGQPADVVRHGMVELKGLTHWGVLMQCVAEIETRMMVLRGGSIDLQLLELEIDEKFMGPLACSTVEEAESDAGPNPELSTARLILEWKRENLKLYGLRRRIESTTRELAHLLGNALGVRAKLPDEITPEVEAQLDAELLEAKILFRAASEAWQAGCVAAGPHYAQALMLPAHRRERLLRVLGNGEELKSYLMTFTPPQYDCVPISISEVEAKALIS